MKIALTPFYVPYSQAMARSAGARRLFRSRRSSAAMSSPQRAKCSVPPGPSCARRETSAEAISATSGLGYRIFLVRRYLSMDVILPYVAWITLLAIGSDYALRTLRRRRYAWIEAESVA